MKKRIFILFFTAFMLLACQPTPDEPVVLQKDQDLMIQKGEATLPPEQAYTPPEAPERWQYDYEEGALTVHVDAKVTVPDGPLPMARMRAQGFDQDAVRRLLQYLANGETMITDRTQTVATKEQLAADLEQAMQMLEDGSYKDADITEEEWKEHVQDLQEQYKKAPFEADVKQPENGETDGTFYQQEASGVLYNCLEAHTDSAIIWIWSPLHADFDASFRYERGDIPYYTMNGAVELFPDSEQSDKIELTYADAMKKVREIIDATGEPLTVTHVYLIGDPMNGNVDGIVQDAKHWAYAVQCQRTYRGVTVAAGVPGTTRTDDLYAIDWEYETMTIILDDKGVARVQWREPLTVTEPISDSTNLLPFDKIAEIAERMLRVVYIQYSDASQEAEQRREIAVDIRDMKLELIRVREQDNANEKNGVLVPVWVCYGDIVETDYWDGEPDVMFANYGCGGGCEYREGDEIVLCINAIDGSIIDPLLGY
ncbi:MAG: hypothetical protein IKZ44_00395 [Clostridia bacterium]|nr:hypothetical protein [Clostridia bacterium]